MRRAGGRSWLGFALVLVVAGMVGVQSGGAARVSSPDSREASSAGISFEPFLRPPLLAPLGPSSKSLRTLRPQRSARASTVITGSITAGGSPLVVTIPTAGDTAAITFSGAAGERVSLNAFNDSILYAWFSFSGPGSTWSSGYVFTSGKFYEPVTLTASGTYTISIDPQGNTGSVSLQLYDVPADPSGSITPGGAPVSVTTTAPGQNASYSFTATAGQRVSLRIDTGTLTSPCGCGGIEYVRLMQGGTTIAGSSPLGSNSWDFLDVQTLSALTYQVVVDPPGDAYGQTTLHLYDVPPDVTSPPLVVNGAPRTLTLGTPGQNALLPFHGQAGQRVTLQWSASTISGTQYKIEDPNGNELVGTNWEPPGTASISTTLSAGTSDNYKIYVNPFADATGQVTLTLTGTSPQENGCGFGGVFFGFRLAKCASMTKSEPVDTLTGAFEEQVDDVTVPGTGVPFKWTRSYTSSDTTVGRLGLGWTDSLAASLAIQQNGDVIVHSEDGQQVYYTKQPDGSFVGAAGALATLSLVGSNYQLVRNDQITYTFDSQGRLTALKDRNNQGLTLTYNGSNQLSTVTDAAGRQATLTYTGSLLTQLALADGRHVNYGYTGNLLTSVTDLNGKTTTYGYDGGNRLATVTDPLGHAQVQNTYGSDGRVTQQKDAGNNITAFAWDSATQTATVTDPRGNVWKDVYQNGVLLKTIDAQSNSTQFGFDSSLNETSVTGPDGGQVSLGYDSKGNLTSATSTALNATKTLTYNARNDPATATDPRGKITNYGYDANGNLASVSVDDQAVTTNAYNGQGQLTSSADGDSHPTTYTYDANGNLASVTDGLGNKTSYTYDAAGNVLTRVDPLGNVAGGDPNAHKWTYTYDNLGHLLTETNPLGKTTTRTYDDAGNLKTVTDALNHVTTYDYDASNQLIKITAPDGGITQYTYDTAGNRLTETDPLNHTTTLTYNTDNLLASATTPLGEKTTYFYDHNGNLAKQVEPRGNVQGATPDDYATTYTYDDAGRVLTQTDPLGHTTTHVYDKVGNQTSVSDANNHATSYEYDAKNRLTKITAPDGGITQFTYDANGNVLTRVDAKNHATTYTYNAADELASVTSPTGQKWTYAYDANGNLVSTVDANGNSTQTAGDGTTTRTYDAANRLTATGYSDSTPGVSLTYDAVGNRTQISDGGGTQTYTYDAANRLTGVTRGTNTFSYAYDLAGNPTSRTYPDGTVTTYGYDNDERLASATSGGVTTSYAYDPASNLVTTTLPSGNGYVETRTYDRAGRLTDVKNAKAGATLSEFAVTTDAVGNPTTVVRSGAVTSTTTYGYDANDRLTSVCFLANCPGGSDPFIRWTYDAVGNRLTEARPTGTTNYTYNNADQMTQAGSTAYTYDQNGNEKTAGSRTFTYDLANRLISTTSGSTTTTYTYDGDGNRLQASTGAQASKKTNYLWDVQGTLPQMALERDGSNALLRRYVYGARRIFMTTGGSNYYYHYDNSGSVANVTSSTGASQWTEVYEPFGSIRTETKNNSSAPANFMKFAGEYQDATGLYYLRARQYDPTLGRFTVLDPENVDGDNSFASAYVYAADRPTVLNDPSGRHEALINYFGTFSFLAASPDETQWEESADSLKGYVNPFRASRGLRPGRTDMGVDYNGYGPIQALGNALVMGDGGSGWPPFPGGHYLLYKLTNGKHAGRYVYVAEAIVPKVRSGSVKAGATIATFGPSAAPGRFPGIETGWSTATLNLTWAKHTTGYTEGQQTRAGKAFARLLRLLGAPTRDNPGPGPTFPR
jgi:RHS repeat-associated protein